MPYGRQTLTANSVYPTRVSADGSPLYKPGGITLDLTSIPAASGSDVTLPDGSIIRANNQYLRYGQILTRVKGEVQTVTVTSASGGTFTLTLSGQTTGAIAWNAAAATVKAAIEALSNVGAGNVSVSGPASGVYTITFAGTLGNVATMTTTDSTTGSGHSVTVAAISAGAAASGKFGPYDPAATDGRAVLARGDCFILDETYLVTPAGNLHPSANDIIGGVFEGGGVWFDRLIVTTGTATLAAGPTVAAFEAAFPQITYYKN